MPPWIFGCSVFDPTVHDFWKAGVFRYFFYRHSVFFQQTVSAAGGEQLDAVCGKALGKLHDAGFIGYAQQGAADGG